MYLVFADFEGQGLYMAGMVGMFPEVEGLLNSGSITSTTSLKLITEEVSLLLLEDELLKVPILV